MRWVTERARRSDTGVTLIELMIAVSLVTLVMAGLVTAMMLALKTTDASRQKITDTSGAQLLTSVLVSDVQSSEDVQPEDGCGGTPVLELRWTDADNATGTTDVQYIAESTADGNAQLVRKAYHVESGCTLQDTSIVVRAVNASNVAAVCTPACNGNATEVGLQVEALSKEPKGNYYSSYTFTVSGTRRTQ